MSVPNSYFPINYDNYALAYNTRTKNPDWVCEDFSRPVISKVQRSSSLNFKQEKRIPSRLQANAEDFRYSGYDKGHYAAAANHATSSRDMESTFVFPNASPMNPSLNRGYWSTMEKYVRDLTKNFKVKIVEGPLFLPKEIRKGERIIQIKVTGKNDVWVPTHFFKVLMLKDKYGNVEVKSYVLPNQPIDKRTPLDIFKTTIEAVERSSGVPLSNLAEEFKKRQIKGTSVLTTSQRNLYSELFKSQLRAGVSATDLRDELEEIIEEIS